MTDPGALYVRKHPTGYSLAATCACGCVHDCGTTSPALAADRLRDAGWLWQWTRTRRGWTCPQCIAAADATTRATPGPLSAPALAMLDALYDGQRAWVEATRTDLDPTTLRTLVRRGYAERQAKFGRDWVRVTERGVTALETARVKAGAR